MIFQESIPKFLASILGMIEESEATAFIHKRLPGGII
jgi:hypothetical protein